MQKTTPAKTLATKNPDTKKPCPLNVDLAIAQITPGTTPAQAKTTKEEKPYVLPMTGYVRLKQLLQIVPFSASTVWRKSKSGDFPAAVKLSDKVTAFKVEDVRAWLASKESA